MTYSTAMRSAVCIAAIIAGSAAHAEVTAVQVWEDWKDQLNLYGEGNVSIGSEETSSGTLTVRDLEVRLSDDEVDARAIMSTIVFNEQSDGTVRVTMDESYPLILTFDTDAVATIDITQQNLEMIVSGEPDALDYAITADQYKIALRDVVDGDVTFTGDAAITANNVDISYETTIDALRNIAYDGTIASIDILVDFQIPGGNGEYVTGGGKITAMETQAEMSVPLDANFDDPDTLINDGFSIAGGYAVESAEYVFDINAEGDQVSGSITNGMTSLMGGMSSQSVGYSATTEDVTASFLTGQFPLPVEFSLGEYGVNFEVPTGTTEEPTDFVIGFDFIDLSISDTIWNLFDAGNVLPRDPASIQLAVSGKVKSLFDMFDPAQQDALESAEMPYEIYEATLDELNIDAAGAKVTGEGSFSFDNEDTQTFAPFPRPEGEASVEISGFNGLLDNLVSMGLVPEQDVMGARMMVGMFARSTGDDQMETSIEVLPNGQVNVNGNRVR